MGLCVGRWLTCIGTVRIWDLKRETVWLFEWLKSTDNAFAINSAINLLRLHGHEINDERFVWLFEWLKSTDNAFAINSAGHVLRHHGYEISDKKFVSVLKNQKYIHYLIGKNYFTPIKKKIYKKINRR